MDRLVCLCALLAVIVSACSRREPPPAARDEALTARILHLVDQYVSASNQGEEAALADARHIFDQYGIPGISRVGDEAAYEFVFLNAAGQKPPFLERFLDAVRDPARARDIPADARAFAERQARKTGIVQTFSTRQPTMPALRDQINAMLVADQAVREKAAFDPQKMHEQDMRTAGPLKAIFDRYGVPTYEMVGIDAAKSFIVMVQHQSPALRASVLPKLRENVEAGQADPEMYAMVYDRAQTDQNRKQLYGENFVCTDGQFEPAPLDDPEHVDERRAEMGLMRLSMYARILKKHSPAICESVEKATTSRAHRGP